MSDQAIKQNNTFTSGDIATNACVGNNGWVDKRTYAHGFSDATQLLIRLAIEDNHQRLIHIDELIYPICFCARHHLELFLKWGIDKASALREIAICISLDKTHNLNNLWDEFERICIQTDKRLTSYLVPMREYFIDFYEIDPTGETFRYPFSQENHKHLVETSLINLEILESRYSQICELIKQFQYDIEILRYEYATGSYTQYVSRSEIEVISSILPLHKFWSTPEFLETREKIKSEYKLPSNREFTKIVNIIRGHREFSSKIGLEIPLAHITVQVLLKLQRVIDTGLELDTLDNNEWASILAVYEISGSYYCEDYDVIFRSCLADVSLPNERRQTLNKVIRFPDRILNGLKKLGQKTLYDFFKNELSFENALVRLKAEEEQYQIIFGSK